MLVDHFGYTATGPNNSRAEVSGTARLAILVIDQHITQRRMLHTRIDCCFIYQPFRDLVLVACCPFSPTPSTASADITRIPFSLPGRRHPSSSSSSHGSALEVLVEFLEQLITALERYLIPNQQHGSLGMAAAATTKIKTRSASTEILSAELVQLNTGIVYEILDECMIAISLEFGIPNDAYSWIC
ncbi:MAG: hypothetical protein J3R72DRAFT_496032 [Linnemannia gamsii]|nr:MAG: hypothetical protein J3R72DRAFT_496032 [Linnemannia gamsii]